MSGENAEGIGHSNSTQEGLCEECGQENVQVYFISIDGMKMQVCGSCREKAIKESRGESKSFMSYFTPESRLILQEIGVTGADNMNTAASKLLKEVRRLRAAVEGLNLKLKEVLCPH